VEVDSTNTVDNMDFGDPITVDMFDSVMQEVEQKQEKQSPQKKVQSEKEAMEGRIRQFLQTFLKTLKREDLAKFGTQDVRKKMEKDFGVKSLKEYSKFIVATISQIGISA